MTTLPSLNDRNTDYALLTLKSIAESTDDRRAGSVGEQAAKDILLTEMEKYCDETSEQSFTTHPGAGTALQKTLGALLVLCVVLFSVSVSKGSVLPTVVSLILNLIIFGAYSHKFLFDGTFLDFIKPKKTSSNIIGRRFCRGETENRIVIAAHIDSPLCLRSSSFGQMILNLLFLLSLAGNTLLFCFQLFFLFSGAPINSTLFDILNIVAIIFIPVYIFSIFIVDPRRTASGISSSLVPCSIVVGVMKQLSEEGVRFGSTEVCFLFTGSEYSGRAGSYAFARKHRRRFTDVPTVFISLEEITRADHLSIFFRDGSGVSGSQKDASIVAQAAENLNLTITKESPLMGSSSFTPFTQNNFKACSIGTPKKYIAKTVSHNSDVPSAVRRDTVKNVGALLLETLNYYNDYI